MVVEIEIEVEMGVEVGRRRLDWEVLGCVGAGPGIDGGSSSWVLLEVLVEVCYHVSMAKTQGEDVDGQKVT